MNIEVLICTHNRVQLLERTLYFINKALCPPDTTITILVAANACTDGTVQLLCQYNTQAQPQKYQLTYFEEPKPGKSNALNSAIPQLTGDIIAMVDDDHRIDVHYFTAIIQATRAFPHATLYCGKILPDWTGDEPGWAHDLSPYAIYPLPVPHYDLREKPLNIGEEGRLPGGGNLVIKNGVFDRVGNFSTALGPQGHNLGGGEDTDFVQRALDAGEIIKYYPPIKQFHFVEMERLTFKYLLAKSFQRSCSATRINRQPGSGIPRYLWRKLLSYFIRASFSLYWPEKKFYMVRVAAALGEIRAHIR